MQASAKYVRSRQAADIRSKALTVAIKRKEEYLGARVPKELKAKVIKSAAAQGIPVSILIRKILEGAFNGYDTGAQLDVPESSAVRPRQDASQELETRYPSVLGWESIRLNQRAQCADCGKTIESGNRVTLGLSMQGKEHIILCDVCSEFL